MVPAVSPDSPDGSVPLTSAIVDSTSLSPELPDHVVGVVSGILDRYSVVLDTKSFPVGLYAESLLYMVYWFHRLRDPQRKNAIRHSIGEYLGEDSKSAVVTALLSDSDLKSQANERIHQGVMVRKTVDVLVMRDGPNGREFLTLDRAFFPE